MVLFVDLHLCPDWQASALFQNDIFRAFRERAVVYDERDEPWVAAPGVYVSLPRRHFDPSAARAWGYYTQSDATAVPEERAPDLLFSFVGTPGHVTSGGHRVRRDILRLKHGRAHIEDSSGFVFFNDGGDPAAHQARQRHFAEVLARSRFVLCPRGRGTSSIRLYEVMRAGRVPVILSDEWVAPEGPDWEGLALRVPESRVGDVPSLLESRENEWERMGAAARRAYEEFFSPEVSFHRIVEKCAEVLPAAAGFRPERRGAYRALAVRNARLRLRTAVGRLLRGATGRRRS